ncbi:hypothetical protein F5X68DRAFT_45741 [Plectosphaerella plurivora]|uniref:Uncharacterized protein n=1 Tax=Plectosphaerella plurivora TaxID=936078 RepID=A0A9P9AEL3_9PEZI|nr:hypothetical protein F5X68DRAFT_45741 [Plectosphaerella plurivora]
MGLVLNGSPDDPFFSQQRHFPGESALSRRYQGRDRVGLARAARARPVTDDALNATRAALLRRRISRSSAPKLSPPRPVARGPFITDTVDDSIRLARSTVALPSDGSRDRVPSLERQDAFRDPTTARPARICSLSQGCEDEDSEVAELYRLGLLYDDEHLRGAGFGLNAIIRDEPTYTLAVRTPRRNRKGSRRDAATPAKLPMDWTFTGLVEDNDVARYLVSDRASADTETRRGYRMVWRAAPAPDTDNASPDIFSETASFYSLQRSALSDSHAPDRDDFDFDDMGWAVLSRARDDDDDAVLTTEDAATGTWVVLGDGS